MFFFSLSFYLLSEQGRIEMFIIAAYKSYNSLADLCGEFFLKQAMDKMVIRNLGEVGTRWLKNNAVL